jgi:hypothetical protein
MNPIKLLVAGNLRLAVHPRSLIATGNWQRASGSLKVYLEGINFNPG